MRRPAATSRSNWPTAASTNRYRQRNFSRSGTSGGVGGGVTSVLPAGNSELVLDMSNGASAEAATNEPVEHEEVVEEADESVDEAEESRAATVSKEAALLGDVAGESGNADLW